MCRGHHAACTPAEQRSHETYHQLLVDDHFADDAVNCGYLQLKHLR